MDIICFNKVIFRWMDNYCKIFFFLKKHNKLINSFKSKLEEVIKHTVGLPRTYLTVSDVDKIIGQSYLIQRLS